MSSEMRKLVRKWKFNLRLLGPDVARRVLESCISDAEALLARTEAGADGAIYQMMATDEDVDEDGNVRPDDPRLWMDHTREEYERLKDHPSVRSRIVYTHPQDASGDAEKDAEIARLNAIINSPQSDDFLRAVSTEAEHQRQRWGSDHDAGKTPADWFWLVGYLGGKALHSQAAGDTDKAEHHIITTAAACANWHRAMFGRTDMRPGIDGQAAMQAKEAK